MTTVSLKRVLIFLRSLRSFEGTIEKIARAIQQNVIVYKKKLDVDAVIEEIEAYMELFKKVFYK